MKILKKIDSRLISFTYKTHDHVFMRRKKGIVTRTIKGLADWPLFKANLAIVKRMKVSRYGKDFRYTHDNAIVNTRSSKIQEVEIGICTRHSKCVWEVEWGHGFAKFYSAEDCAAYYTCQDRHHGAAILGPLSLREIKDLNADIQ